MSNYAARAYANVGVNTAVEGASPHKLVLMLYDAVLKEIRVAKQHMQRREIAPKAAAISKAIRLIDQGLRLNLDMQRGGDIAAQLSMLYDYSERRLLHANIHNDPAALDEVNSLIEPLRQAWVGINPDAQRPAPQGGKAP
jgi:flagellar secretion chaperone FliS